MELRLKQLLEERGMTAKDFADKLGVTPAVVYQVLNSNKTSYKTLEKYASLLGVPVWEMVVACPVSGVMPKPLGNSTVLECPKCGEKFMLTLNATKL